MGCDSINQNSIQNKSLETTAGPPSCWRPRLPNCLQVMSPIRRFFSPHFFLRSHTRKNHTTGLWAFPKIKQLTYFQAPASDGDSLPPGRKWEPWSLTPGQHKRGSPSTMPAVSNWIIFIQEFLSLWYKQVCVCADLLSNPLVCRIRFFFSLLPVTQL